MSDREPRPLRHALRAAWSHELQTWIIERMKVAILGAVVTVVAFVALLTIAGASVGTMLFGSHDELAPVGAIQAPPNATAAATRRPAPMVLHPFLSIAVVGSDGPDRIHLPDQTLAIPIRWASSPDDSMQLLANNEVQAVAYPLDDGTWQWAGRRGWRQPPPGMLEELALVRSLPTGTTFDNPEVRPSRDTQLAADGTLVTEGRRALGARLAVGLAVALGMFVLLTALAGDLASSIQADSTARITRLLLTAAPARTLLAAKLLARYPPTAASAALALGPLLALVGAGNVYRARMAGEPILVHWGWAGTALLFGLAGAALYAWLAVAVASITDQRLRLRAVGAVAIAAVAGPLTAMLMWPYDPMAPGMRVLSIFPLAAPILLPLRAAADALPLVDALAAFLLLLLASLGARTAADRLYRHGLVMPDQAGIADLWEALSAR